MGILLGMGALLVLLKLEYFAGDLRNNLWAPSYLLLRGKSPYRVDVLVDGAQAVWFPQVIGLFFPIGLIEFRLVANIWLLVNFALVLLLIWWLCRKAAGPVPLRALLLTALFPPIGFIFYLGQFNLLALLLLLLTFDLLMQERFILAGFCMAVALAKPQIAFLALPGYWILSYHRGRWRGAWLFPAAILLSTALLTVPLWIGYPAWVPDFLRALTENPDWLQPTLYTAFVRWWGPTWRIVPAVISAALFLLNLRLWWRCPPQEVLPWSLALTTVATPYIWTWDFVLLLPLIFDLLNRQTVRSTRLIWGGGYLLLWFLTAWPVMGKGEEDHSFFWWMPWLILALAFLSQAAQYGRRWWRRQGGQATTPPGP